MPPPGPAELPLRVLLLIVIVALPRAVVVDAAARALVGRVAADCAAAHRKARVIIIDAAAEIVGGRPVGDRQPGDGHVFAELM